MPNDSSEEKNIFSRNHREETRKGLNRAQSTVTSPLSSVFTGRGRQKEKQGKTEEDRGRNRVREPAKFDRISIKY